MEEVQLEDLEIPLQTYQHFKLKALLYPVGLVISVPLKALTVAGVMIQCMSLHTEL